MKDDGGNGNRRTESKRRKEGWLSKAEKDIDGNGEVNGLKEKGERKRTRQWI